MLTHTVCAVNGFRWNNVAHKCIYTVLAYICTIVHLYRHSFIIQHTYTCIHTCVHAHIHACVYTHWCMCTLHYHTIIAVPLICLVGPSSWLFHSRLTRRICHLQQQNHQTVEAAFSKRRLPGVRNRSAMNTGMTPCLVSMSWLPLVVCWLSYLFIKLQYGTELNFPVLLLHEFL